MTKLLNLIKKIAKGFLILVLLFVLATCVFSGDGTEKIKWDDLLLGEQLPEISGKKGNIHGNSDTYLSIDIAKQDLSDFDDYVDECIEVGYTIEQEQTAGNFDAFNKDGYQLSLYYSEYNEELSITLNAPMKLSSYSWPSNKLTKLLPSLNVTKAKVINDNSTHYSAYLADISYDEMKAYFDKCMDKGFDVDYSKGDTLCSAENKAGYKLEVKYEGFNIMYLSIKMPEEETSVDTDTTVDTDVDIDVDTITNNNTSNGIDPEFKEAVDSYVEFFKEYVEFMNKYAESENSLTMLADYTKYMSKYADTMKKIDAIDDEDLTDAEAVYLLDAQTKINKLLLEVE